MTKQTDRKPTPLQYSQHNTLGPIVDDRFPSSSLTTSSGETQKRRAPRVGLKGGRNKLSAGSLSERMEARTVKDPTTGCWNFQGCKVGPNGYGQIDLGGGMRTTAHRAAWILVHGTIPDGKCILHTCDNPRCVNVTHLRIGTQAENVHESIQKGRYKTFGIQKLDAAQVFDIRERVAKGETQKSIARRHGIARNTVSGIVRGKSWAHLTKPLPQFDPHAPIAHPRANLNNVEPVRTVALEIRGDVA